MKRPDSLRPDGDGRVIVRMALLDNEQAGASEPARTGITAMTRKETRCVIVSATLAGLTVAAVLSLALVGLVLFCQFIWFR
jgi:hypothetical protein